MASKATTQKKTAIGITKRQLVKWVNRKRQEALALAHEQHDKSRANHTERLRAELGISELAEGLTPLLDQARVLIQNWQAKSVERVQINVSWGTLPGFILRYTDSKTSVYEALCGEAFRDTTTERRQLEKSSEEMKREVDTNYLNIMRNIETFKNAEVGLEYLKGLGFDVAEFIDEVERPLTTALAVPIDTRYLFLNKE